MIADHDNVPVNPTLLEHEAYAWVVRFVSGQASPADIKALKEWSARSPAHAEAFDQASKVWKALDPARRKVLSENVLAFPPAARSAAASQRFGRRAFLSGAIAASAAGAAFLALRPPLELWPSLSEFSADYRTHTGEQRGITLAGSVSVEMNTQTSIALRSSSGNSDRFELIAGEALVFAPKSSVTVLAADGRVVASGARFNVRYVGQPVCVTCLDGVVEVATPVKAVTLSAGRQVIYSASGIGESTTIDPRVVTSWKDGVVIFDGTPISEVIAEINRYRHGKVILTNAALGRERFNARFKIENIDRVVDQIAQVFGVRTRSLPGGITLLG
ncbi:FecR family protein [Bradyrhizobium cenepequi]|uniref:FecR family protein n=1 Tax=Bradyrhizobium cenepequi TaxID=2821403 RepID=UPI001CE25532|nr:FecR domain-containing protein [Bradyrhizobium cenepequi]MCA6109659.1 FecR domain-containing protein [Bradyrhizobium cenepequi]